MTNTPDPAAIVRACASFVRDTYSGEWADDAAATLETDADQIERGEPCSLLRLADTMRSAAAPAVVEPPADQTAADVRDQLLHAIDFNYVASLGYTSPEELLAAYDTSRTQPADRAADAPAAECSAQHRRFDDGRLCIRAAQHHGDHIDERGYHWSDTVAVYPVADGTVRTGTDVRAEVRRMADETATEPTQPDSTTLLELVRDFLDPDPCSFDHHGYCQAHGYLGGEPMSCPHGRARKLLAALEQPAAGARQDQTAIGETAPRPCRTFVSGGTVWCCEEGETDCPCVCHQPAAGARQDGAGRG